MKIKDNVANEKYLRYYEDWKNRNPDKQNNIPKSFFELHSGYNEISALGKIGDGTAIRIAVKAKMEGHQNVKLFEVFIDREIEIPLKLT